MVVAPAAPRPVSMQAHWQIFWKVADESHYFKCARRARMAACTGCSSQAPVHCMVRCFQFELDGGAWDHIQKVHQRLTFKQVSQRQKCDAIAGCYRPLYIPAEIRHP